MAGRDTQSTVDRKTASCGERGHFHASFRSCHYQPGVVRVRLRFRRRAGLFSLHGMHKSLAKHRTSADLSQSQAYLSDTYSVSEYSVSDYGEQVPVSTLAIAPMPATPSPHSGRRRTLPKLVRSSVHSCAAPAKIKLKQEYRPPTPPLAVHGKRGRTVSDEGADMEFDTVRTLACPLEIPLTLIIDIQQPSGVIGCSKGCSADQATCARARSDGACHPRCSNDRRGSLSVCGSWHAALAYSLREQGNVAAGHLVHTARAPRLRG